MFMFAAIVSSLLIIAIVAGRLGYARGYDRGIRQADDTLAQSLRRLAQAERLHSRACALNDRTERLLTEMQAQVFVLPTWRTPSRQQPS